MTLRKINKITICKEDIYDRNLEAKARLEKSLKQKHNRHATYLWGFFQHPFCQILQDSLGGFFPCLFFPWVLIQFYYIKKNYHNNKLPGGGVGGGGVGSGGGGSTGSGSGSGSGGGGGGLGSGASN